jgi:hypothetical protein
LTGSVTGLGVVIADVIQFGLAAAAGLRLQDIIDAVDDRQFVGLPGFAAALYLHPAAEDLKLEVLRGRQKISVVVPAMQRKDERYDLSDFIALETRSMASEFSWSTWMIGSAAPSPVRGFLRESS